MLIFDTAFRCVQHLLASTIYRITIREEEHLRHSPPIRRLPMIFRDRLSACMATTADYCSFISTSGRMYCVSFATRIDMPCMHCQPQPQDRAQEWSLQPEREHCRPINLGVPVGASLLIPNQLLQARISVLHCQHSQPPPVRISLLEDLGAWTSSTSQP